jgi:hypothetical protein
MSPVECTGHKVRGRSLNHNVRMEVAEHLFCSTEIFVSIINNEKGYVTYLLSVGVVLLETSLLSRKSVSCGQNNIPRRTRE